METGIDAAPFLGLLGTIVMWFGLMMCLLIIRGFIVQGTSMAISEFLLKIADDDARERVCRWLGDKDRILGYLSDIAEKTGARK